MSFDWKKLLNSLLTAAVSGAVTSYVSGQVNLKTVGAGALVGVVNLLRQTPIESFTFKQ